jgi:hypothetical protein
MISSHGYLEVDEPSDVKVQRSTATPGVLIVLGKEWTITAQPEAALAMAGAILRALNEPEDNVLRLPMGKARRTANPDSGDAA